MDSIKIILRVLSPKELATYACDERFYTMRSIWAPGTERDKPPHLFVLRIAFQNQSSTRVTLPFSNQSRKAELLGLTITDDVGQRVEPTRNVHVLPKAGATGAHEIEAGESYIYDLVGEIRNDDLIFPGAKYALPRHGEYHIRFSYQGRQTNDVVAQL